MEVSLGCPLPQANKYSRNPSEGPGVHLHQQLPATYRPLLQPPSPLTSHISLPRCSPPLAAAATASSTATLRRRRALRAAAAAARARRAGARISVGVQRCLPVNDSTCLLMANQTSAPPHLCHCSRLTFPNPGAAATTATAAHAESAPPAISAAMRGCCWRRSMACARRTAWASAWNSLALIDSARKAPAACYACTPRLWITQFPRVLYAQVRVPAARLQLQGHPPLDEGEAGPRPRPWLRRRQPWGLPAARRRQE